jgi:predicted ester cyclase
MDAMDELVDADVVSHSALPGQAPGREGFKAALSQFREAFSDWKISVHDLLPSGDKVVGYFTVSAVHTGELFGMPATNRPISYDEVGIVRFRGGKIVEHWSVADTLAMMQTLGAVAPVGSDGKASNAA